ncbi:MAG TPA: ribonuclease E/G, partial [Methyloversatilis sp.]
RRGGRRERGERRPDAVEGGAINDVAAVEGDIAVTSAAANEAPVQPFMAAAPSETEVSTSPETVEAVADAGTPAVVVDAVVQTAEAVVAEAAVVEAAAEPLAVIPVQTAQPVAEVVATVATVVETPEPLAVEPEARPEAAVANAAPLSDSSESTLVRAMESFGSAAPAPVQAAPAPSAAPAADMQSTLASSGLVLVETQAALIADSVPVVSEQPQVGRRRRQAPVISNEPMQQVETRGE